MLGNFSLRQFVHQNSHSTDPGSNPGLGSKMSEINPYGLIVCVYVRMYLYIYGYKDIFRVSFGLYIQSFSFILSPNNPKINVKTNCTFASFLRCVIELNSVAFRKEYRLTAPGNLGVK